MSNILAPTLVYLISSKIIEQDKEFNYWYVADGNIPICIYKDKDIALSRMNNLSISYVRCTRYGTYIPNKGVDDNDIEGAHFFSFASWGCPYSKIQEYLEEIGGDPVRLTFPYDVTDEQILEGLKIARLKFYKIHEIIIYE